MLKSLTERARRTGPVGLEAHALAQGATSTVVNDERFVYYLYMDRYRCTIPRVRT